MKGRSYGIKARTTIYFLSGAPVCMDSRGSFRFA